MTVIEHVRTISRNGQVSIPPSARSRWNTRKVIVVDLGDRVVIRPVDDEPVGSLEGRYALEGPSTDVARRRARSADAARELSR